MSIGYVWLATLALTCILGHGLYFAMILVVMMIDSGEFPRLDARGHVVARAFSGASSRVTVTPLFPSKALTREGITIILSFTYASLISTLAFVPGYKRTYGFTLKATKPCPRSSAPGVDTSPPTISSCQSLPCRIYCVDTMLPCHQRHK
jgi:hypothetical protein